MPLLVVPLLEPTSRARPPLRPPPWAPELILGEVTDGLELGPDRVGSGVVAGGPRHGPPCGPVGNPSSRRPRVTVRAHDDGGGYELVCKETRPRRCAI